MSTTARRILISIAVLFVAGCVCLSVWMIGGAGVGWFELNRQPAPVPTRSQAAPPAAPAPTREPAGSPTPAQPSGAPQGTTPTPESLALPDDVAQQMDGIEGQVLEIRGLQSAREVPRYLLSAEQLRQRVMDDFFKDYSEEDARDDAIVLHAFGFIPAEFDLLTLYVDLYSEIIAGFYDQEEDMMYIVQGESFKGPERLTYSHEYTHALQDQTYDIENGLGFSDEGCEDQSERCAGVQALIEGDASLVEQLWLYESSTAQDKIDLQEMVQNSASPVFDSAPLFLQQDLMFPYIKGLEFVQSLYDRGGWEAIDDAYANPPVTTEQILHPDQYPADQPAAVSLPDASSVLGGGWRQIDEESLGEWYTFLTLAYGSDENSRLPEDEARQAAAGWEGDRYAVFVRDSDQAPALMLVTEWDGEDQAGEFATMFLGYGEERWGDAFENSSTRSFWETPDEASLFFQDGTRTVWVLAPDVDTARGLETLLENP